VRKRGGAAWWTSIHSNPGQAGGPRVGEINDKHRMGRYLVRTGVAFIEWVRGKEEFEHSSKNQSGRATGSGA